MPNGVVDSETTVVLALERGELLGDLQVDRVFTPNGDGVNDELGGQFFAAAGAQFDAGPSGRVRSGRPAGGAYSRDDHNGRASYGDVDGHRPVGSGRATGDLSDAHRPKSGFDI